MGLSGAEVEVGDLITIKRGPGVGAQAVYAQLIGVGPEILAVSEDEYVMRTMDPIHVQVCPLLTLRRVIRRLYVRVWAMPRPAHDWRTPFIDWASRQPHDPRPMMQRLYWPTDVEQHCHIHGDPTLSNVVYSPNKRVMIIDPIEPKGKIPGFPEVDIGKMLQSVIGWEHAIFGWAAPEKYVAAGLMGVFSELEQRRSLFWLGVHALRILPYAVERHNDAATRWALRVASEIFNSDEDEPPCATLMTLMAHSRTLAEQSSRHTNTSE